jgi:flavin-binding protein dodecin
MATTYKHIKVTGQSSESIEGAIRAALQTSAKSVRGHSWFELVEVRGNLSPDAEIQDFQVTVELGFAVTDAETS